MQVSENWMCKVQGPSSGRCGIAPIVVVSRHRYLGLVYQVVLLESRCDELPCPKKKTWYDRYRLARFRTRLVHVCRFRDAPPAYQWESRGGGEGKGLWGWRRSGKGGALSAGHEGTEGKRVNDKEM